MFGDGGEQPLAVLVHGVAGGEDPHHGVVSSERQMACLSVDDCPSGRVTVVASGGSWCSRSAGISTATRRDSASQWNSRRSTSSTGMGPG